MVLGQNHARYDATHFHHLHISLTRLRKPRRQRARPRGRDESSHGPCPARGGTGPNNDTAAGATHHRRSHPRVPPIHLNAHTSAARSSRGSSPTWLSCTSLRVGGSRTLGWRLHTSRIRSTSSSARCLWCFRVWLWWLCCAARWNRCGRTGSYGGRPLWERIGRECNIIAGECRGFLLWRTRGSGITHTF